MAKVWDLSVSGCDYLSFLRNDVSCFEFFGIFACNSVEKRHLCKPHSVSRNNIIEMSEFIKNNLTLAIIISSLLLIVAIWTLTINRKKFRFDRTDFENKKSKFSLYLENSYRFQKKENSDKYLLFDIRITNSSLTKNSLIPKLKIEYFAEETVKNTVTLEHNPDLFDNDLHNSLTKLSKEIRMDEKEIKSGWVIFKFPSHLNGKRINFYELSVIDGLNNTSKVVSNLIKDIIYGDK